MDSRVVLKSIRMENFGCFKDQTVEFDTGINQLIGPNESGKSTITRAIFTILFEDSTTRKKGITEQQSRHHVKPFRLTLDFSVGGKDFILQRDYGAGFDKMTDTAGIVYEGKAIREKLDLYFGTGERKLFEAITCFSSDYPQAPDDQRDRIFSALELPVFDGFDRAKADHYLDEEIKKLENPQAHSPRELDVISEKLMQKLHEKNELDEKLTKLAKDQEELDEVRGKALEYEQEIARLEESLAGAEAYQQLNNRMISIEERLQNHLNSYSRASQLADDLDRVQGETKVMIVPPRDQLKEFADRSEKMHAAVENSKRRMDTFISRRRKANWGFLIATLLLLLTGAAYFLNARGVLGSDQLLKLIKYAVPTMGIVWLIRLGVYVTFWLKKKKATARFRADVKVLDDFYAELNECYNLQAADPIKAIEEAMSKKNALEMSASSLRGTIGALSDNKGMDYLTKIKEQLEIEVAALNRELEPLNKFAATASKLPEVKEQHTALRVRLNAMRERIALLEERCSVITSIHEAQKKVNNEIEALKRNHHELNERLEVLKITRLALNHAADRLIQDRFDAYCTLASRYFENLTDGSFRKLRYSEEKSGFEVKDETDNKWIKLDNSFSSSTRDAIYLALRLAAAQSFAPDFAIPMIFDQAEVRMDQNRANKFRTCLSKLAEIRQVILIGVTEQEINHASHTVNMLVLQKNVPLAIR